MILFMHGLDSNNETNKFTVAIHEKNKYCETIDYRGLSYLEVSKKYDEIIERVKPTIIIGHSLGGFWALIKSQEHNIPCFLINPSLYPKRFLNDYPLIKEFEFKSLKRAYHIEMDDEVLSMDAVKRFAKSSNARVYEHDGGHHRVQYISSLSYEITDFLVSVQMTKMEFLL